METQFFDLESKNRAQSARDPPRNSIAVDNMRKSKVFFSPQFFFKIFSSLFHVSWKLVILKFLK